MSCSQLTSICPSISLARGLRRVKPREEQKEKGDERRGKDVRGQEGQQGKVQLRQAAGPS